MRLHMSELFGFSTQYVAPAYCIIFIVFETNLSESSIAVSRSIVAVVLADEYARQSGEDQTKSKWSRGY